MPVSSPTEVEFRSVQHGSTESITCAFVDYRLIIILKLGRQTRGAPVCASEEKHLSGVCYFGARLSGSEAHFLGRLKPYKVGTLDVLFTVPRTDNFWVHEGAIGVTSFSRRSAEVRLITSKVRSVRPSDELWMDMGHT